MKTTKIIFFIAILGFSTTCNDLLDLKPIDYFAPGNFWVKEETVNGFMNGLHNQLRGRQWTFQTMGELRDGQLATETPFPVTLSSLTYLQQRISEEDPGVSNWGYLYDNILQINIFIEEVEKINFLTEQKKNMFLGQAYGLRAFYYFHLLRSYGGVPLRLSSDVIRDQTQAGLSLPRSSEAEIMTQIKKDVDHSINLFTAPAGSYAVANKGLWTLAASRMLKGEIFLWSAKVYGNTADFTIAKTVLDDANFTNFGLITTAVAPATTAFGTVFNSGPNFISGRKNKEIIFAMTFNYLEASLSNRGSFLYTINADGSLANCINIATNESYTTASDPLLIVNSTGLPRYLYKVSLFLEYEEGDKRRDETFLAVKNTLSGIEAALLSKFIGQVQVNYRRYDDDFPIYREADRLLMLAEIENAIGGDFLTPLNKVRRRAFEVTDGSKDIFPAQGDEAEIAIFKERLKEFVWEGKGWYDLRRMKVNGLPMAIKQDALHPYGVIEQSENYKLLLPIDKNTWTVDPAVNQTPGYTTVKP